MSELGKKFQIIKKIQKKLGNQYQNAACEQKTTSDKWKFGPNKKKLGLD